MICFWYFFVFSVYCLSACRSLPSQSGPELPNIIANHTNWIISPSLSPSLIFKPVFYQIQCRNFKNIHQSVRQRSDIAFLLLLAGDVSVNPGPDTQTIKIACANVRSVGNKCQLIKSFIGECNISTLSLTETHLLDLGGTQPDLVRRALKPQGFGLLDCVRQTRAIGGCRVRRGGGVGYLHDERFTSCIMKTHTYSSFEHLVVTTDFLNMKLNIVTIYRPTNLSQSTFCDEFEKFLSYIVSQPFDYIITGDFNLHLEKDNKITRTFNEILDNFNLKQHVNFPTHNQGRNLDLFITSDDFDLVQSIKPADFLSDHCAIIATLKSHVKSAPLFKTIKFRPFKKINMESFRNDLLKSELICNPKNNSTDLYNQYHTILADLVNRHAPLKTKKCSLREPAPWITEEVLTAKRTKRYFERTWRRTKSATDRRRLSASVHRYNHIISKAKNDWYKKIIKENESKPKKLWESINHILHKKQSSPLPDCSNISDLANSFATFFKEKIDKIRAALVGDGCVGGNIKPDYVPPLFNEFKPVTEMDVLKLLSSVPNKFCDLDPCPTSIVKECMDILVTPITKIINLSLSEGIFPSQFKQALVSPLLKKPSLPKNEFKNYRPVSNLNFISKLLEKVVASQIKSHMAQFSLDNSFQSAYKSFHSTETALLSVQNDIYMAMEKGQVTALTLLDLSAAFDTIDHSILLDRLSDWFGFCGGAINWLKSYLCDRFQSISIQGVISDPIQLLFGVPQGSVLGPLLFIMYTTPLSKVISKTQGINHHLYADDTQVYNFFTKRNCDNSFKNLQNCLGNVQDWMFSNKLKLNPDKTEFLIIGNKSQRAKFSSKFPISLLDNDILPAPSARNLGVTFDSDFNFISHINSIVKSCNYHLRDFRRIRKHLDQDTATALGNALISSRLDYCNSLLFGAPSTYIKKLQRIQNSLARIITQSSGYASASKLLESLHWLPVKSRIHFKVSLLCYKAVQFEQPPSLAKFFTARDTPYDIRSVTETSVDHPPTVKKYGDRAFSFYAPSLWNKLPQEVRESPSVDSFRKRLKTYYFNHPP